VVVDGGLAVVVGIAAGIGAGPGAGPGIGIGAAAGGHASQVMDPPQPSASCVPHIRGLHDVFGTHAHRCWSLQA